MVNVPKILLWKEAGLSLLFAFIFTADLPSDVNLALKEFLSAGL
jgi:hypothetical protein